MCSVDFNGMLTGVDEIMADEVALMEEAELEALAALNTEQHSHGFEAELRHVPAGDEMDALLFSMDEHVPSQHVPHDQARPETPYGSDDDEYDHIFMDVIQEENRMAIHASHQPDGDDMMDTS